MARCSSKPPLCKGRGTAHGGGRIVANDSSPKTIPQSFSDENASSLYTREPWRVSIAMPNIKTLDIKRSKNDKHSYKQIPRTRSLP